MPTSASDHADKIRKALTTASPGAERTLAATLRTMPAGITPTVLDKATRGLPCEVIGFALTPHLVALLQADDDVYRATLQSLGTPTIGVDLREVLSDAVDKAARGRPKASQTAYFEALRRIARQTSVPHRLRTRAIRNLVRDDGAEGRTVIGELLRSRQKAVANASGHVVAAWARHDVARTGGLAALAADRVTASPRASLKHPGLILAALESGRRRAVLRALADDVRTTRDRDRFVRLAGPYMHLAMVREMLASQRAKPSAATSAALAELLKRSPARVRALHANRRYEDYLHAVSLAPSVEQSAAGLRRIERIILRDPRRIAQARELRLLTEFELLPDLRPIPTTTSCSAPGRSYATGFQMGDALYRDLMFRAGGIFANHWHVGLFWEFASTAAGEARLRGIQMQWRVGDTNMNTFQANTTLREPEADLAAAMTQLRRDFELVFADNDPDRSIHAIRTYPGMTRQQRRDVIETALDLVDRDFGYTWADMLDYKWHSWSGQVEDIDELRCDGVVEYCYEKHDLRVCDGERPDRWKIAAAGRRHAENHNDFHTHGYGQGELCPRVQAGDEGNDSNLVAPDEAVPVVAEFSVSGPSGTEPVRIDFKVDAPLSRLVYCRLVVSPEGEDDFRFVRSEDVLSRDERTGDWLLLECFANAHRYAFWNGRTALNGPDHHGRDGRYRFRLQAIDQGGNVSAELCRVVQITW